MSFSFKNWLRSEESHNTCDFWEMVDLKSADTSHINLEPTEEEFDRDRAQEDCEMEVQRNFDRSEYESGIYDSYNEDPRFKTPTVEKWEEKNPKPEREDFEDDEEFRLHMSDWEDERNEAQEKFDADLEAWEEEQQSLKDDAEEKISDAMYDEVQICIERKAEEHLEHAEKGFEYKFEIDEKEYKLVMEKSDVVWMGNNFDNIYVIYFTGPQGFSTTGEAGTLANAIYGEVVLGLKKFVTEHEVDGLQFSAFEPKMKLMYDRFYNTFMKEKFIRVSSNLYLKKDLVRDIFKKRQEAGETEKSRLMAQSIISTGRTVKEDLEATKYLKFAKRPADKIGPLLIGHFVPLYNRGLKVALVINYQNGTFEILSPSTQRSESADYIRIALPWMKITPKDIQGDFISYVQNLNYDDPDYFPIMKSNYLKQKYNISDMSFFKSFGELIKQDLIKYHNSPNTGTSFSPDRIGFIYPELKEAIDKYSNMLGVHAMQHTTQTTVQPASPAFQPVTQRKS